MVELKFKDIESLNAITGALHKNGYKYSTFIIWKKGDGTTSFVPNANIFLAALVPAAIVLVACLAIRKKK